MIVVSWWVSGWMVVGSGWLSLGECLSLDGCRLMIDSLWDGFGYSSLSLVGVRMVDRMVGSVPFIQIALLL